MSFTKYRSQQLQYLVEFQLKQHTSGVLTLETQVDSWQKQKTGILVIHNKALVYGGYQLPNNYQFAKILGDRLNPKSINTAISVAKEKLANSQSVRELIAILVKFKIFTWESIETQINHQVVAILEQFNAYPGKATWNNSSKFDLCFGEDRHGLNWLQIKQNLKEREQQWASLAPTIPNMDAAPYVSPSHLSKVSDARIREHLNTYADGRRTLVEIATAIGQDPLKVAIHYSHWINSKVVCLIDNLEANYQAINLAKKTELPKVLSIDDSNIVQLSIKRALSDHYSVLLAHQVSEALTILNRNSIDLLLLDLTMPDMDGLELCNMIRKIDKFRNLPIIILTARDGLIDQVKGQINGANEYICKPFKPEQLLAIVNKYIKVSL